MTGERGDPSVAEIRQKVEDCINYVLTANKGGITAEGLHRVVAAQIKAGDLEGAVMTAINYWERVSNPNDYHMDLIGDSIGTAATEDGNPMPLETYLQANVNNPPNKDNAGRLLNLYTQLAEAQGEAGYPLEVLDETIKKVGIIMELCKDEQSVAIRNRLRRAKILSILRSALGDGGSIKKEALTKTVAIAGEFEPDGSDWGYRSSAEGYSVIAKELASAGKLDLIGQLIKMAEKLKEEYDQSVAFLGIVKGLCNAGTVGLAEEIVRKIGDAGLLTEANEEIGVAMISSGARSASNRRQVPQQVR